MSGIEFQEWPKMARLFKDEMVITEKIDGTNSAVVIESYTGADKHPQSLLVDDGQGNVWEVAAQSRKRLINPLEDNAGFAKYVWDNAEALIRTLGVGRHFGEWWGSGIQRGYGLPKGEKRFSLFNTARWGHLSHIIPLTAVPNLYRVPILYRGVFDTQKVIEVKEDLQKNGSWAAVTFPRPEGVVVFHEASNHAYKSLLEGDDLHKWQQESK